MENNEEIKEWRNVPLQKKKETFTSVFLNQKEKFTNTFKRKSEISNDTVYMFGIFLLNC